jgi:hypothetical protein
VLEISTEDSSVGRGKGRVERNRVTRTTVKARQPSEPSTKKSALESDVDSTEDSSVSERNRATRTTVKARQPSEPSTKKSVLEIVGRAEYLNVTGQPGRLSKPDNPPSLLLRSQCWK